MGSRFHLPQPSIVASTTQVVSTSLEKPVQSTADGKSGATGVAHFAQFQVPDKCNRSVLAVGDFAKWVQAEVRGRAITFGDPIP